MLGKISSLKREIRPWHTLPMVESPSLKGIKKVCGCDTWFSGGFGSPGLMAKIDLRDLLSMLITL